MVSHAPAIAAAAVAALVPGGAAVAGVLACDGDVRVVPIQGDRAVLVLTVTQGAAGMT